MVLSLKYKSHGSQLHSHREKKKISVDQFNKCSAKDVRKFEEIARKATCWFIVFFFNVSLNNMYEYTFDKTINENPTYHLIIIYLTLKSINLE
jgi:hypothetical protein